MDINKVYYTWHDIENLTQKVISHMRKENWVPTIIVGITRGGLIPATLISHQLKTPMCSLDVSLRDNNLFKPTTSWIPNEITNGHRILIVDDLNDTGQTFSWIKTDWQETIKGISATWPENSIKFAALMHNVPSPFQTDFWGIEINKEEDPRWVVYPWESD
jgi:hypoxanthine phosphoribosyltransferase